MVEKTNFTLRIRKDLIEDLDAKAKKQGFTRTDIIEMIIAEWLREKENLLHYNVYEDHITIWDAGMNRLVDVYIHNNQLSCDFDLANKCKHIEFAKKIPKVQKAFAERGVKLDGEW